MRSAKRRVTCALAPNSFSSSHSASLSAALRLGSRSCAVSDSTSHAANSRARSGGSSNGSVFVSAASWMASKCSCSLGDTRVSARDAGGRGETTHFRSVSLSSFASSACCSAVRSACARSLSTTSSATVPR